MIRCVKYSINVEKLHAVFICYELYQKSRQAVADMENAMKIIIAAVSYTHLTLPTTERV